MHVCVRACMGIDHEIRMWTTRGKEVILKKRRGRKRGPWNTRNTKVEEGEKKNQKDWKVLWRRAVGEGSEEWIKAKYDDAYVRKCHNETYAFVWWLKKLKSSSLGFLSKALAHKKYHGCYLHPRCLGNSWCGTSEFTFLVGGRALSSTLPAKAGTL